MSNRDYHHLPKCETSKPVKFYWIDPRRLHRKEQKILGLKAVRAQLIKNSKTSLKQLTAIRDTAEQSLSFDRYKKLEKRRQKYRLNAVSQIKLKGAS